MPLLPQAFPTDSQGRQIVVVEGGVGDGGSSSTQYTEGATQATATGTVLLWKDVSNVLRAISASTPLPVTFSGTFSLPSGASTSANQVTANTNLSLIADSIGAEDETVATNDDSVSGLNGLFKRLLQRFTTLLGRLPASLGAQSAAGSLSMVPATGTNFSTTVPVRTPTTTNVSSSATSVTVLAANANRRGVAFWNDSTAALYISFSVTAARNNALLKIPADGFLLLDQQLITTGAITGIWSAANGSVNVTEFV